MLQLKYKKTYKGYQTHASATQSTVVQSMRFATNASMGAVGTEQPSPAQKCLKKVRLTMPLTMVEPSTLLDSFSSASALFTTGFT